MGGYGSMLLGLKHPDMFCSVGAHSSAFSAPASPERWEAFGPPGSEARRENDLFLLAEQADRAALPALFFDCGVDDFLIQHNRDFHSHLESLGAPHHYAEHPGAHDWEYWDLHIRESLAHHCRALGITGAGSAAGEGNPRPDSRAATARP